MSYRFGKSLVVYNGLDKDKEWTRGYFKSILFSLIAYIIIVAAGFVFVIKGGQTAETTKPISGDYDTDLITATNLLNNKSIIDYSNKNISYLNQYLSVLSSGNNKKGTKDSIQLASENKTTTAFDTIYNSLMGQSTDLSAYMGNLNFQINIENSNTYPKTAKNADSNYLNAKSLGTLGSIMKSEADSITLISSQLIDYYLNISKFNALNGAMVSSEYVDTNSIKMINNVSGVLSINSGQMNKITQKLLGPNLRNLQEWGVVMFLFLLLTMLSLHQFIKLNFEIASWQLKALAEEHEIDKDLHKAPLIEKAKQVARLEGPSKKLWLVITAGLWLFIPLIKPIEDEQINIESPFKQITPLNNKVKDLPVLKQSAPAKDTVYQSFLMVKKDSVFISSLPGSDGSDSSLSGQLNRMEAQMKKMETAIEEAKGKIEKING
jgi:hypothetical protein